MTAHWYALQTKARKEALITEQLEQRGVPVFYPHLVVKPVNPRSRTIRPFFPSYVFVKADLGEFGPSAFRYLPFAVGLVSFGGEPAVVDDALLQMIDQRLTEINAAGGETFFHLRPGDRVIIEHGPFAQYEAIFDARLRDSDRVRVLIDLLGDRQMRVELKVNQIRPL